ncbi:MAG TPA: zinc ribbon domain-containing protein [Polyangiaceae bacterium]|jgi:putative FmdB family regulatory protein|nr:zinc ribbon domain-containing protein [Polyangiaceae bacterium]
MPTYEYACGACGHQWEQVQRIVEAPIEVCPKCAQSAAHRLISGGTNFILKGGGWYSDLYSSSKKASEKTEKTESSASPSTGSTNGGEKSEAKTESKAAPAAATPAAPAASSTPSTSPTSGS